MYLSQSKDGQLEPLGRPPVRAEASPWNRCLGSCAPQAARKRREEAGVELYGHQQHLAQLHEAMGSAAGAHAAAQAENAEQAQELQRLREEVGGLAPACCAKMSWSPHIIYS